MNKHFSRLFRNASAFTRPEVNIMFRLVSVVVFLLGATSVFASEQPPGRPPVQARKFHSEAVEKLIVEVKAAIGNPALARMFENCFPNTLDTTVTSAVIDGVPDTYVITGDIDAMWLRDSSAQVDPYLRLCAHDAPLSAMINGLIRRQARCILLDPYANAFYRDPKQVSHYQGDMTDMKLGVHERKWELDSLCYPIRLAHTYWKIAGDASAFDETWLAAMRLAVATMRAQQRKDGRGPYHFMRKATRPVDTLAGNGFGNPWRPTGMICSAFRNSDDAAIYLFNIPENLFAVSSLGWLAEILDGIKKAPSLAADARALAVEVEAAVRAHGIVTHPKYGQIYAYECDGFGNVLLMDDAGSPGLIAIPFLGYGKTSDEIYQNSRRFALSEDNPYFYRGKAGEGMGGPHLIDHGDFIWPMGIATRGITTDDPQEILQCLHLLAATDAGTGFMHEGFDKDNAANFTRSWFAWANTWFGEFVWKVYREHPELLRQ